ncbi:MAG TPA: protein kinase [Pyrinomonadaceae bacterium]|jgi:serine/threonine protein kinase/tetratricopeptide (TPR) repeat protein|nr:protein kinase [Pyrinomonadaceae bacterium]
MDSAKWRKITELFEAALERPADERAAYLETACDGDEEVRRRVEEMLAADARENLFIDRPAYNAVGTFVPSLLTQADSQSFSGEMIGDYRLVSELGEGGMGAVYLAYDTRLGRNAALKFLPSRFHSPERVLRLEREARAASALNHPHILTIYDFGQQNGRDFIASEFVEGRTLREHINANDLTLNQILEVAIQVASALGTAHAAGIIHRDIKPENIMLRPDGYAKVLDFGLAKLTEKELEDDSDRDPRVTAGFKTRTGILLGTTSYMSPEQVRGQPLDGRSDLFSLGVVLYELISGQRPFRGETVHHTMVAITDSEPTPIGHLVPRSPARFQDIISQVLAKDPDERYQTAGELISDLEELQSALAMHARADSTEGDSAQSIEVSDHTTPVMTEHSSVFTATTAKKRRRVTSIIPSRKWLWVSVLAAIVAIAIGGIYFYRLRTFGARPPALTEKDTILLTDFVNTTGDPDFDGTLKQGLTVQLEQSPYISIFPEERARDTLQQMERARDEKITREIGREICQRRGIKVLMIGSIASLGRNYVITLEGINSQSGETVAHQQTEVEGKEQVLRALGRATTAMREKLGESLASIRKFDMPIETATTASLEAFKDFIAGVELRRKAQYAQSVTQFKRAIELDPEFALAHVQLGTSYRDLRNLALGNEHVKRAYELRDRVTERERFEISATYFRHITGELDKRIEMTSLLTQTYPRDPDGFHLHGNSLMIAGEFEQAAQAYRTVLQLDPDYSLSRANLALALIGLNRFDDAQQIIQEGLQRGLDSNGFHNRLYIIGFLKQDAQLMERQVQWFSGRPDEYQIRELQARALAFAGRRREASASLAQAAALAAARGLLAEKARILANDFNLSATFGMVQLAANQADQVLTLLTRENISAEELQASLIGQLDSQPLAWTLALSGDARRAQSLADDFSKKFPLDTIHNSVWLPIIRATMELKHGESAERAVQFLPPSKQYEPALSFKPTWVRGLAYLQAKNGAAAASEFQRIIDHRGWDIVSPLWPLAHLGLARAAALQGDTSTARKEYESFFDFWKEADADLPVMIEAKREYEKLK